jgi:hypothetical protein
MEGDTHTSNTNINTANPSTNINTNTSKHQLRTTTKRVMEERQELKEGGHQEKGYGSTM